MKDTQVNLHINKEIRPVQQKQRRIPFNLRSDVEKELERLGHNRKSRRSNNVDKSN